MVTERTSAVRLRPVLRTANPIRTIEPILSGLVREGNGSIFSQKTAGRKKQMMGAAVDPIRPRTKSSGGLTQAISQVNRRINTITP